MIEITGFWNKHKVFILGLLAAISVALQQFVGTDAAADYKVVGFAVFMAVLSYLASKWRGQGVSITGIIGMLAAAFITEWQTGKFSWSQFAIQAIVALIAAASADPKSRGYESAPAIQEAKKQGEDISPALLTKKS